MKRADRKASRGRLSAQSATQAAPEQIPTPEPEPAKVAPVKETPLTQIVKFSKSMDWKRVHGIADAAIKSGELTDEQVDQAIDSALPSPERAATLPLHRLVAIATAASPARRKDYLTAIQNYPGLDSLAPDAKGELMSHIQQIGLEA